MVDLAGQRGRTYFVWVYFRDGGRPPEERRVVASSYAGMLAAAQAADPDVIAVSEIGVDLDVD